MREIDEEKQRSCFVHDEISALSNKHGVSFVPKNSLLNDERICSSVCNENDSSSDHDDELDIEDKLERIKRKYRSNKNKNKTYLGDYDDEREGPNMLREESIEQSHSNDKNDNLFIHEIELSFNSTVESYEDITSSSSSSSSSSDDDDNDDNEDYEDEDDDDDQSSLSEELMSQIGENSLQNMSQPSENDTQFSEIDSLVSSSLFHMPVQPSGEKTNAEQEETQDDYCDGSNNDDLDLSTREKIPLLVNNKTIIEKIERNVELETNYNNAVEHLVHKRFQSYLDLIHRCPEIISIYCKKFKYQTILHKIAEQDHPIPEDAVLKTISYDPSIVSRTDVNENTALHYAANTVDADNYSTFRIILNTHSFCAGSRNKERNLPLHLAAVNGKPGAEEAVRELYKAFPRGIISSNQEGQLPLHLACISGVNNSSIVGILLSLHKLDMSDIAILDINGNSPLHAGIKNGCSFSTVSAFNHEARDSFLNAYIQKDINGDVPLHSALREKNVDSRIILSLIQVAPFTGGIRTKDGLMPIQLATDTRRGGDIIEAILATDLPLELGHTRKRLISNKIIHRGHGHSWWHIAVECGDQYTSLLMDFLSKKATFPQIISLALSVGPDGQTTIIAAAGPGLKEMFQKLLRILGRYQISPEKILFSGDAAIQSYAAFDYVDIKKSLDNVSFQTKLEEKSSRNYFLSNGYTAIMSECRSPCTETETEVAYLPWHSEGKEVTLRFFEFSDDFESEINLRNEKGISDDFVESIFNVHNSRDEDEILCKFGKNYDCIAFERKTITLEELLIKWERENLTISHKMLHEIIRDVTLAINHIHKHGVVHGRINSSNISMYGDKWKLMEIGMAVPIGKAMNGSIRNCSPPESFYHRMESVQKINQCLQNTAPLTPPKNSRNSTDQSHSHGVSESDENGEAPVRKVYKKKSFLSKFSLKCTNESSLNCINNDNMPGGNKYVKSKRSPRKKVGCFIFRMEDLGIPQYGCVPTRDNETTLTDDNSLLCKESGGVSETTRNGRTKQSNVSEADTDQNLLFATIENSSGSGKHAISAQEKEIIRLRKALEDQDEMYRNLLKSKKMNFKRKETQIHHKTKYVKDEEVCFAPERVMASPSWDLWSLGVIIVRLIIGKTHYLPAFEENIDGFQEKSTKFCNKKLKVIQEKIKEKAGVLAADLIFCLLQPNPSKRMSSTFEVLEHKYFLTGADTNSTETQDTK